MSNSIRITKSCDGIYDIFVYDEDKLIGGGWFTTVQELIESIQDFNVEGFEKGLLSFLDGKKVS